MFWRMVYEAAQNLPLIGGCLLGIQLWQDGQWLLALISMAIGSLLAALVIWITEPLIFRGHRETGRQVAGNVVTFLVLMFVCTLYFTARWSSGWTDLVAGLLLAVGLAIGQETAARERFGYIRAIWLGVSCIGSLLAMRWSMIRSLWIGFVIVNLWFTIVMGLYKELRLKGYMGAPKPVEQESKA